jgi:hypothetical protein
VSPRDRSSTTAASWSPSRRMWPTAATAACSTRWGTEPRMFSEQRLRADQEALSPQRLHGALDVRGGVLVDVGVEPVEVELRVASMRSPSTCRYTRSPIVFAGWRASGSRSTLPAPSFSVTTRSRVEECALVLAACESDAGASAPVVFRFFSPGRDRSGETSVVLRLISRMRKFRARQVRRGARRCLQNAVGCSTATVVLR